MRPSKKTLKHTRKWQALKIPNKYTLAKSWRALVVARIDYATRGTGVTATAISAVY